jgi:F-type H+-transporting ATPase subunit epsilon
MRLTVSTPLSVVIDLDDVTYLRAEDNSGAFGVLPGHADFLTVLSLSVATWRDRAGAEHHIALRGGMLEVRDGQTIAIATREAIPGDDLHRLETEVLASFRRAVEDEQAARSDAERLYLAAIRQIYRLLRPERGTGLPGAQVGEQFERLDQ